MYLVLSAEIQPSGVPIQASVRNFFWSSRGFVIEGESIRNKKADLCRSMCMKFNAVHVVYLWLTSVTKVISETLRSEVLT